MKEAPTSSWSAAKNYFFDKRQEISEAGHTTASNAAKLISGVNTIERFLRRGETTGEMEKLKGAIEQLDVQKRNVLAGVGDAIDRAEAGWRHKVEQVFRAQVVEKSLRQNVSLIVEDTIGNKFIDSLGTNNFGREMELCVAAFENFLDGAGNFNPTPVEQGCRVNSGRLRDLKNCLRQNRKDSDTYFAVEGKSSVFLLGRTVGAERCFRNVILFKEGVAE